MLAVSADASKILEKSFKDLSATQILAKTSTMGLTEAHKIELIQLYATDKANYSNITSTTALSTTQKAATTSTTGFTTALKGLWATMMANPLIAIGMAVTAISTAWNVYYQSIEKTRQATADAASTFGDMTTSINDYADKYKKLHDELTNANTTEERQHEIKNNLLSLQQELNDKYGEEYGRLNLVTDAYKDQTEAILSMNRASAKNYLLENRKGIDDATRKMEQDRTYSLGSTGYMSNDYSQELYKIASQYTDRGIDLTQFSAGNETGYTIKFTGNAEQADKVIHDLANQIQDLEEKFKDNNFVKSFLDNSENALKTNNKILDDYQDIYNSSLIAQIAADNTLSEGYANATNAVNKYNEAIASGDESKILSARKNLDVVKSSIDLTSDDWKRYGNVMTDIFSQANTGLYDFRDALSSNNDNIKEYAKSLNGLSRTDLLSMADDGQDDYFDKITESADKYGLSVDQVIDELVRLKYIQDDVSKSGEAAFTPLSKQEVITNINSLSEGFESLDKIMKSISDEDNPFDYALLDDKKFKENFDGLGESYAGFVEKVSSSPKDIKATQIAFNDLVTTWIDSSGVLNGLTEDNSTLATSMLQNMGVANAEEVVMSRLAIVQEHLAAEKAYTAEVSNDLANATANEIPGIIDEATQSDIAKVALAGLVLEKEFFNGNALDTSGDIENILSLVGVIGTANTALQALNTLKAGGNVGYRIGKEGYNALVRNAQQEVDDAIKAASEYKGKGSNVNASYGGGTKTNKSSGSGSKKDKTDTSKDIDWIDRQLKLLEEKRSQLVNKISDTYSDFSSTTHDQILELDKTLISEYTNAVNQYQSEYDKAVSKISAQNKAKIENGSMSVDTLSGKELENVQAAIDAYDKLTGTQEKQSEAHKTLLDDIKSKYDDISKSIENENSKLKDSNSILESQMEYYKSAGIVVDSSYYNRLIQNTSGLISNTRDTISNKRAELRDLLANGVSTSSQEYLDLKSEIADAETNVYALKKAQEEYNNQLKQMPIDHLSTIISMYQDINTAISNWGSEVEASGKKLDGDYYQKMISNGDTIIKQYQKQAELIKDVMDEYETGSDNWQQLYSQLQSINSEMSTMVKNLRQYNEELLRMPLENIDTFSSGLQKVIDGLNGVRSEQDTVISAVTGALKEQIDLINEQKEATNKEKEAAINALKEKLSLLEKENEYRKLQYDLEQKQFELERARNQRTNLVVRNGVADYEKDVGAERKAQEALLDSQYNLEKYNLQEQINKAQESLDAYNDGLQDQIDALQKISDKWSEIGNKIIQAQNEAKADEILGSGWKDKVLSGNDAALFNAFSGMYQNTSDQLQEYQKQLDTTNNINALLEDYIASYKAGEITYEQAMTKINVLLSQMNESMSAMDNLQNIYDYLGTVNGVGADADSILKGIQDGLADTADELVKSLEQYNKNSGMISEYSSSWEQLTDNVRSMLDVLKEVRDNLRDAEDDSDDDDDEPYDKSRGKGWGIGDVNNGPGVQKYADGIENGLVGKSSDSEREKMINHLATNELKPGEVPILAHTGEAILNDSQQNMLMKNLGNAASFMPNLPDYSSVLNGVKMVEKSNTPTIHFNGGITIEKCDTPDEFARGIMDGKLALALGQRLGRR